MKSHKLKDRIELIARRRKRTPAEIESYLSELADRTYHQALVAAEEDTPTIMETKSADQRQLILNQEIWMGNALAGIEEAAAARNDYAQAVLFAVLQKLGAPQIFAPGTTEAEALKAGGYADTAGRLVTPPPMPKNPKPKKDTWVPLSQDPRYLEIVAALHNERRNPTPEEHLEMAAIRNAEKEKAKKETP